MSTQPANPPANGNGHFHLPKWLGPALVTYMLMQGGTSIFGAFKQSNTAASTDSTAKATTDLVTQINKNHEISQAQQKWLQQQMALLNARVTALEAKGK